MNWNTLNFASSGRTLMNACSVRIAFKMESTEEALFTNITNIINKSLFCTQKSIGYAYSIILMNLMHLMLFTMNKLQEPRSSSTIEETELSVDLFSDSDPSIQVTLSRALLDHIFSLSKGILNKMLQDERIASNVMAFIYPMYSDLEQIVREITTFKSSKHSANNEQLAKLQLELQEIRKSMIDFVNTLDVLPTNKESLIQDIHNAAPLEPVKQAHVLREKIAIKMIDALEDSKGLVRVFLRYYKPSSSGGGIKQKRPIPTLERKAAAIFEKNESTDKIYDTHFKSLFETAKNGKNICIFGYGYSGSGKTYTLLGNGTQKGILNLMFDDFTKSGDFNIVLQRVYELYGSPSISRGFVDMQRINHKITKDITSSDDLRNFLINIEKIRKDARRIKETILNPESSRSHLVLQFAVYKKGEMPKKNHGMITFLDLGGRENPVEIYESLNQTMTFPTFASQIMKQRKNLVLTNAPKWNDILDESKILNAEETEKVKKMDDVNRKYFVDELKRNYLVDIILEGFFINDSLNKLQTFLSLRHIQAGNQGKVKVQQTTDYTSLVNYNVNKVFVTDSSLDSVLSAIDNDNNTKFVMICCVRHDSSEDARERMNQTIMYGNSISSTDFMHYNSHSGSKLNEDMKKLQEIIVMNASQGNP